MVAKGIFATWMFDSLPPERDVDCRFLIRSKRLLLKNTGFTSRYAELAVRETPQPPSSAESVAATICVGRREK
jgi:hypothetical protein